MEETAYKKNMLVSFLLHESLEQLIERLQGEEISKIRLTYRLLTSDEKKQEFNEIFNCINAVKRNISIGNYRMALRLLVVTQLKINRFQTSISPSVEQL